MLISGESSLEAAGATGTDRGRGGKEGLADEQTEEEAAGRSADAGHVGAESDAGELARAHAHLRREIRHGLHLMIQESNPCPYYAHVQHGYS